MRKSTRIVKRIFALLLVVLMSIESIGAVVSDNDGSAFITKAEFDSLKNNFQSQIDQYNTSIDSKIDGAIASYLAGINIKKKRQIEPTVSNYADMVWKRKPDMYGDLVTWTGTGYGTQEQNKWKLVPFDILRSSRYVYVNWLFNGGRFGVQHAYGLRGDWMFDQTDIAFAHINDYSSAGKSPRCYYIDCAYDEVMGKIVHNTGDFIKNLGTMVERRATSYRTENVQNWNGSGWTEEWSTGAAQSQSPILSTNGVASTWLEDLVASDGQFINAWIKTNRANARNQYMRWNCMRKSNEVNLLVGGIDDSRNLNYENSTSRINLTEVTPGTWTINPNGIHHFYIGTDYAVQNTDMKNLMLGDTVDYTVNILRLDGNVVQGGDGMARYKDEFSTYFEINTKFTNLTCHGDTPWTLDSTASVNYASTYPKTIKLRLPYAERYDFNKIAHPQFRNNDVPVSIGEGLELVPELTEKGEITIEFDYSVDIPIGTLPSDGTGIKVDLKKSNFLTNTNDYVRGLRNDETTAIEMRDAFFDTTDRKAKIVIDEDDLAIGDNIYIRIAPKSTAAGLRAHMSNLKVTFETSKQ